MNGTWLAVKRTNLANSIIAQYHRDDDEFNGYIHYVAERVYSSDYIADAYYLVGWRHGSQFSPTVSVDLNIADAVKLIEQQAQLALPPL